MTTFDQESGLPDASQHLIYPGNISFEMANAHPVSIPSAVWESTVLGAIRSHWLRPFPSLRGWSDLQVYRGHKEPT